MASKAYEIAGIGVITIIKRRGNRNIRLSFDSRGQVRVSLPYYAPYAAGVNFARTKRSWIISHRPASPKLLIGGQLVARKYQLVFKPSMTSARPGARLMSGEIVVTHPAQMMASSDSVQTVARRGAVRAIKKEAEEILPPRLASLANLHGYKYNSVTVKPLKTRWGSCDQSGNIKLNIYLVELADELIDYVLLHELAHTKFQHHQANFWAEMRRHLPNVDQLKKRARAAQPGIATN